MTSFMQRKRDELQAAGIDPARLPNGQYITERFPVLHLGPVPTYSDLSDWTLHIGGDGVGNPTTLSWNDLRSLPTVEATSDIHCVTKWSKLDVTWQGVRVADLLELADPNPDARTLTAVSEHDYSSTILWTELQHRTALVAWAVNGAPLEPEHGYPLRLVVPHLYFWKSAKWLRGIQLWNDERHGYWERNGYHRHGDPFVEERYWGDDAANAPEATLDRDGEPTGRSHLSKPIRMMLERALNTSADTITADIERLREACALVLRRHLATPADSSWPDLVEAAARKGEWNQWRRNDLLKADAPESDDTPEVTRDTLGELAEELLDRGAVLPGVWEGSHRQIATASEEWNNGKRRRDLIFSLESLPQLVEQHDSVGLHDLATSIRSRDTEERFPGLPQALTSLAKTLSPPTDHVPSHNEGDAAVLSGAAGLIRVGETLQGTPFAAVVRQLIEESAP